MRQLFVLVKWGLWQRRWFLLWWSVAIGALIVVTLIFYPSFKDQAAQLEQSLAELPDSAKALTTDTGEFASPVGFLSSQIFYLMLPMLLGIMSISLGSSLLAREEKDGTIELLLSRTISRAKLLLSKSVVGIILIGLASLIAGVVTVAMAQFVDLPVPGQHIAIATLAAGLFALVCGAIALLITCFGKARIASIGLATFIALGGYIIVSLSSLASWLKTLSKAFPFNYYKPGEILYGNPHWRNALILGSAGLVCGLLAWVALRKRDIGS